MSVWTRVLAILIVGTVWTFAAFTVASGPLAAKAIAPAALDAAVKCVMPERN